MNGIDRITDQITSDAQNEAQAILAQAKAEEQQVLTNYRTWGEKSAAQMLETAQKRAIERESRMRSVAELEGRKKLLNVKQELIEQAFDKALAALLALPEAEYEKLLCNLVAKASETGKEELIFSQKDHDKYGTKVVASVNEELDGTELTLSQETREILGGVILKNGQIEINCALETQVRMLKDQLALEIAQVLFA